jgi:DNA-directed RNA polymerase subunit RPC12/RpoP
MTQGIKQIVIEINAEHTEELTRVACLDCNEAVMVKSESIPHLKGCPYCLSRSGLYSTYTYIAVATMREIPEIEVTLKINGNIVTEVKEVIT